MNDSSGGADRTLVEVWLNYYGSPEFLENTIRLAERFGEVHPEYRVDIRGFDYRELPQMVADAARRGVRPAVAQYFYSSAQLARDMLAADGSPLFVPIERAVAGREEILGERVVLHDVLPAVRDYYSFGGEVLAMSTLASTTLLYANMSLLAKAGVTEAPQTWEEVEAACRALSALPDGPAHSITWPNHGWIFQQAVAEQGGLLADHDNGRSGRAGTVDLLSKEMLAFVRWWQQLHREGHYLYTGTKGDAAGAIQVWSDNFDAFAEQRVAFVLSSSVEAEFMVQAGSRGGFEVQACPLPYNGAVQYAGSLIGGDALWLTAGLEKATEDGALAFLQFLNNPENAADRHRTGHYIPVTGRAVELLEQEGWFAAHPHRKVALDQLGRSDRSAAARGALLGDLAGIQDVMVEAMHDVLAFQAEPLERFTRASAEAQKLLDEYNAHCLAAEGGHRGPRRFYVA